MSSAFSLLEFAGLLLLLGAAWCDLQRRIIPNQISLGVAVLGAASRLADGCFLPAAGVAAAVFLALAVCWRFGLVGGGDVKLLSASALLVPPGRVLALLLAVSVCGGLMGLAYLALGALLRRRRPAATGRRRGIARLLRIEAWRIRRRAGLPYGCAIALGTLLAIAAHSSVVGVFTLD